MAKRPVSLKKGEPAERKSVMTCVSPWEPAAYIIMG